MIGWIGRALVLNEIGKTAPDWIVMFIDILSFTPWWAPLLVLVALFGWLIWYDLRALKQPINKEIDGGTF